MRLFSELRLRTSVTLLLVGTILVTLVIVGSGLLMVMISRIGEEDRARVTVAATEMASRVEAFLDDIETRVEVTGSFYGHLPASELPGLLAAALEPTLSAVYLIDSRGTLVAASIADLGEERTRELVGIDLSAYPVYVDAMGSDGVRWSDKHISAVTGAVTLGVAARIGQGEGVIVAELPLKTLLNIARIAKESGYLDYWVVDSKGELVADTGEREPEGVNVYNQPIIAAGFGGTPLPETMSFGGTTYRVSASYSHALGWLFVSRIPAGLSNPHLREVVSIILIGFIGSVVVGLLLAPLWAQGIVRPLRAVADRAHQVASGAPLTAWPRGSIAELNQLSDDLGLMGEAISRREEELRQLNEELEARVGRRTEDLSRSNRELRQALATLEQARDDLINSEKLAALGRLVAGVAHELNTPLGNGRMAITTLADKLTSFENSLAEGLRRSQLEAFIESVRTSTQIAESNMVRAGDLIGSFKQVAADRTASRRRKFRLSEVVDEVLLTLSPSMKGQPVELRVDVPRDLWLDSYPGELGQTLTNLIENCITHAFKGCRSGAIAIDAHLQGREEVTLRVSDNGVGMAPDVARRAFDPFFTTALGRGGTGLGLFIVHNSVTNVLGGTISLDTRPGEGTRFELRIPLVAPAAIQKGGRGASAPFAGA